MRHGGTRLLRALATQAGASIEAGIDSVPWHSGTFAGQRHMIVLRFADPDPVATAERLLAGLEEHEFDLPGWIVADIVATGAFAWDDQAGVTIEALLIEER